MNRAASFKTFSMIFGIVYSVCFYLNWSPFRYYPEPNEFHLGDQIASAGPAILWYGWLAVAAVVSAGVAVVIPAKWIDRVAPVWFWLVPAALLFVVLFYEKRWFL